MFKRFPFILLLSINSFSLTTYASENAELEQAIRQLEAAKQALERAQQQVDKSRVKTRFYFDYKKAKKEIDMVRSGIHHYLNNERAQPRDPRQIRTLSGEYEKIRQIRNE